MYIILGSKLIISEVIHANLLSAIDPKIRKIVIILIIAFGSRFIMELVSRFNSFIITSQSGILKYFYINNRKWLTLNTIFISIIKYVIYFTALGLVIHEFGISVKTYLTGISFIGLALAFGAQGFVQDIVTGFFVLFENQFSIGDMVEIGGQIGIVESMGLRMTQIRNFLGEAIYIPNRNIAIVGNFTKGYVRAFIDIAIEKEQIANELKPILLDLSLRLQNQFPAVVFESPEWMGLLKLADDELYVRIKVKIWPGQTWVIERDFTERIRTNFTKRKITIPNDRISVFYQIEDIKNIHDKRRTRKAN